MIRRVLGQAGEAQAVAILKKNGYQILHRNYCSSSGEIDIIAYNRGEIVFLEVKACKSTRYGPPELKVTQHKRLHLLKAAQHYIREKGLTGQRFRFDVVSIHFNEKGEVSDSQIIKNAFSAEGFPCY
jgi:putative endonuclease